LDKPFTTTPEFCHILLAAGAQVDVTDWGQKSALHLAAAGFDNYGFIIAIIDSGCLVDLVIEHHDSYHIDAKQRWTALMIAVDELNTDSARALLDRGASTNVLNAAHFFPCLEDRDDYNKAMEMYSLLVSRVGLRFD
jgi:ankyrin repeat protein